MTTADWRLSSCEAENYRMNCAMWRGVIAAALALSAATASSAAVKDIGEICIAPFHARRPPPSRPGLPPPPVPPGEASLSDTTWEPQYTSEFKFFINGRERATLHDGEVVHLTGLPTAKRI